MSKIPLEKFAKVLSNETNRGILKLLYERAMTNMEIYNELKSKIVCRESVFKALKKLVDGGLVKKFYDKDDRLYYKILHSKYVIDLIKETAEPI